MGVEIVIWLWGILIDYMDGSLKNCNIDRILLSNTRNKEITYADNIIIISKSHIKIEGCINENWERGKQVNKENTKCINIDQGNKGNSKESTDMGSL